MKRTWFELKDIPFDEYTLEEKKWYCQIMLGSTKGEEYKKWYNIYNELCGCTKTFDEVVHDNLKSSTPTKGSGSDYSPEREYRGY